MIYEQEQIGYGYNYDSEKNLLIAREEIRGYGFFSSFTLLITALMKTYRKFKTLPDIDGKNLLRTLFKTSGVDGYRYFFHINEDVSINFEEEIPVPLTNDDQHTIYKEENAKYYHAFFQRYFNFNPNIKNKIHEIKTKYDIDFEKLIAIVYRSTDKWTDMGGFNHISPALYLRLARRLKEENQEFKTLIQSEKEAVKRIFHQSIPDSFSIEETLTTENDNAPLFLTLKENLIEWAEYYVASLYICSQAKHLVTYTGNSAFFMYLSRGNVQNMYQETTFTKNDSFGDFFAKNGEYSIQKESPTGIKMSIGDIADRYSICKLKSERLNLDNSKELKELKEQIDLYQGIEEHLNTLYSVNGQIWDLEADIRKKNEEILGLEEVGRRAIKIRDLNALRVSCKNDINSKYNEGYVEYKINHGCEKEPSVVISLTTVPERLENEDEEGLKMVISQLCEQEYDDCEVHFNIPNISRITNKEYKIPDWLHNYKLKYKNLKIFRVEDMGPPTKVVPTIQRLKNPETIIIVVDDDLIYHKKMVSEHVKYHNQLKDGVICYDGRGSNDFLYNDIRDTWIICVTQIRETHGLQHYKSASYRVKYFNKDFFDHYLGKTMSDDVLISRYFFDKGIRMYVVPYEDDVHLFETKELWDQNQGVTTFPILRGASSVVDTGCNNPEILKIQPKFYEPDNLGNGVNQRSRKYETDKFTHGYIPIYQKYFSKLKNATNVLEIGIGAGESLRYWSDYFENATIYGIDIRDSKFIENERIKTFIGNQEKPEDLNNFLNTTNCEFDIIIDDGGHMMKYQQTSFGILFKRLKSGGIYVIEDLHTSDREPWMNPEDEISTLNMLKNIRSGGEVVSNYISQENKEYLKDNIESVYIWSRTPDYQESVTSIIFKK
jgi:hypothetical protein